MIAEEKKRDREAIGSDWEGLFAPRGSCERAWRR